MFLPLPILTLIVLMLAPLAVSPASAAPMTAEIKEWTVPYPSSRPRDPSVTPDGKIWFVGQEADYAAHFDPATGQFRRVDLPPGAGPHTIYVDKLGRPWYTGNTAAHIGRINPVTGAITRFPTPATGARDPHTITFAPDNSLWFTSQQSNSVGRLDTATGTVTLLTPPTARALPYGIVTAPNGILWVALFGTNKLARIDPVERRLTEVVLPRPATRPRRIGVTSDGTIWYVDNNAGYLGRYIPATGAIKEWPAPAAASSHPYAMTTDDRDRVWFVEAGVRPNRLVGFDPKTETFAHQPIPSGGGTVRHMVFDVPTRSIWFGTDANTLGRATLTGDGAVGALRPPAREQLSLRVTGSSLSITLPQALAGNSRSAIYSLSGGVEVKRVEAGSADPDGNLLVPIGNMARGWYVYEVQGPDMRLARPFRIHR